MNDLLSKSAPWLKCSCFWSRTKEVLGDKNNPHLNPTQADQDLSKVNSVQQTCAQCFVVHILKFEISQTKWKIKTKIIKMLDLLMKNWNLRVWCSLFPFFSHVILRFQILICEPHSIWRKLLVLSWHLTLLRNGKRNMKTLCSGVYRRL